MGKEKVFSKAEGKTINSKPINVRASEMADVVNGNY